MKAISAPTSFATLTENGVLAVGDGYRAKLEELGGSGPIFLRAGKLSSGGIDWTSPERFLDELAEKVASKMGHAGDTVITTKGNSVGRAGFIRAGSPAFVYSPHLSYWRSLDHSRLDPGFLRYWAQGPEFREQLRAMAHGTDMAPYLSLADQNRLVVTLPDTSTQMGISAALGALDDKIESNRTLQALAEALGSAVLESVLEPDVYGYPEYAADHRLGDVISVLETGSRPRGGASVGGAGVVSLGAESVQSAGVTTTTSFKTVPHEYAESMRRGRLEDEDVLVYKDGGTPGNFTPHVSAFGHGFPVRAAVINEHVYRTRARAGVSQGLLYWVLRSPWMDQEMRKRGTGVAIPGLNSSNFRDLPWPRLSDEQVALLNAKLSPLLTSLLYLGTQNRTLATLRDVLLPELLSGRIRVPEAEDAVAEVIA